MWFILNSILIEYANEDITHKKPSAKQRGRGVLPGEPIWV